MIHVTFKDIKSFIKEQWYSPLTITILLILAAVWVIYSSKDIKVDNILSLKTIAITIIALSLFVLWYYTTKVPKAPKNKVGFVLAIVFETEKQSAQLVNDFIFKLRELIYKSTLKTRYSFILLPQYYAQKIITEAEAYHYLNISKSQFMIYGKSRIRKIQGVEQHVLNMEGIVRHKPIPQDIGRHFSLEFSELFPRKLLISFENDLFSFEFTAELVNLVAMYVIGIASHLSGDVEYSHSLFLELEQKIKNIKTNFPVILKIKRRLPIRLAEINLTNARFLHEEWRQTRNLDCLAEMKYFLDKILELSPGDYNAHLLRAIYYFVYEHDVHNAINELRKCKNIDDATWRYSLAFLYAYSGDMTKSIRMYKSAFRHSCDIKVPFEVEEFICWLLEKEPDKVQLHLCLGLLNYFAKGDIARALQDLEKFLELSPQGMFDQEKQLAISYINEIRKIQKTNLGRPNNLTD